MTNGKLFIEREESLSNLWLFIVINTTVLALLINILSLYYGNNDVAPNLFYIPVVIAAYWYPHRGPIFAVLISAAYLGLVYTFLGHDIGMLITSSVICYVLIGVSVVVSSLATHMRKNEVKYRSLFNHSQAGVGLVDLKTLAIREVNSRFALLLSHTEQELLERSFGDFFIDAAKKEEFLHLLTINRSVENFEARFHADSGGTRWVLLSAGRLPDDSFVVNVVDITERKHAELALLIKDHAISSSINAIAILDLDHRITYVNQSLLRLMEFHHEEEFIGRSVTDFINSPQKFASVREALSRNNSWFGEIALLKYNKKPFYVLLWMNVVRDDSGNPLCIMASFIDITDRKQMEMAKRKALEQIEKNIEQFAILGDHIRNPLAVIVGLSSLAPGDITEKIVAQAREIDRIITQLDMGWIESEKVRDFIKKYYQVGSQDHLILDEDETILEDGMPGEFGKS
ncbi:MAG: PAS domain-containing protein [Methanomicrobiales archaeon]|nr:PAS domain-containing protein [Methanomicrobiales archaeon]